MQVICNHGVFTGLVISLAVVFAAVNLTQNLRMLDSLQEETCQSICVANQE